MRKEKVLKLDVAKETQKEDEKRRGGSGEIGWWNLMLCVGWMDGSVVDDYDYEEAILDVYSCGSKIDLLIVFF